MAENLVIECPATPERIDQCPATPDRVLNLKSPNSTASSDTEWATTPRAAATSSPPPNCAICLGRCKNKCFTDSCLHQFCFKCLLEWSKVKAECPLCKQPFKSIIHNVKSIDQFEEYLVGEPQASSIPRPIQHRTQHFVHLPHRRAHSTHPHRFDVFLGELPRFRNSFSATVEVHPPEGFTFNQLFLHPSALADRFRQQYPNGVIPPNSLGLLWRQYIYERKLYAMPVVDITGRYRECSARYYRDNPARVHRLMSWIQRDLVCLLRDSDQVNLVLNSIEELLKVFNISSAAFRRSIQQFLGTKTSHFVHELLNFARSPYDLIGYDREVRYTPCYEEVIVSSSSSSSSSESEDVIHIRTAFNNVATASTSQTPISLDVTPTNEVDVDVEVERTMELRTRGTPQESNAAENDRNITLSSSSSDECEFVMERKAPHLRTPELVSLNSDSDSDVVFIKEIKRNSPKPTTQRRLRPRKSARLKETVGSELSDSEDEMENSSMVCAESSSVNTPNVDVCNSSVIMNTINCSNTSIGILDSTAEKLQSEDIQIKGEYNKGASTSSGLCSNAGNDGTLIPKEEKDIAVKKNYARPVRQSTSRKRRNGKSIYESSSDPDYSSESDSDVKQSPKKRQKKGMAKKTRAETNSKNKSKKNVKRKSQKQRCRQKKCRHRKSKYSSKHRRSSSTTSTTSLSSYSKSSFTSSSSSSSSSSSETSHSGYSDYSSSS